LLSLLESVIPHCFCLFLPVMGLTFP
jgi:hypothetical protein